MLELFMLINQEREIPLALNRELSAIAQERAEYLCNKPFSHNGWTFWLEGVE